ncbi:MAG TPA: outer membrane beta-barrel protein [Chitinophagaceae bacterium]|nr:outer membrane beta-barrel protein [Chitinophagaceae bacterium]
MAANEFEKNVRQVMGEFKVHPSDEVWKRVEERISSDKRRRRIIFFIIFSFVALALGGYGIYNFSRPAQLNSEIAGRNRDQKVQVMPTSRETTPSKQIDKEENFHSTGKGPNTHTRLEQIASGIAAVASHSGNANRSFYRHATTPHRHNMAVAHVSKNDRESTLSHGENIEKKLLAETQGQQERTAKEMPVSNDQTVTTVQNAEAIADSSNKEIAKNGLSDTISSRAQATTSLNKTRDQHQMFKKWNWGFSVSLGASTITQDPFSFKGTSYNNASAYSAPGGSTGGGPAVLNAPSSNTPAFSFKVGLSVKRQLSDRSSLSAGLTYSDLADKIKVGPRQTFGQPSNASRAAYSAAAQRSYTDGFHFIELPFIYDWRMTKKGGHYFSLNGGASMSYLVSTNALVYDTAQHGIYYHDNSLFNRPHLNFLAGICYHFARARNVELSTGPQFSFDVRKLIDSDVDKRKYFFYIGLNTRVFFDRVNNK